MFPAIRFYWAEPHSINEDVQRGGRLLAPRPGTCRLRVAFAPLPSEREDQIIAVSVFEDQQSAEESNRMAVEWVVQNLSQLLRPAPLAGGQIVVYGASK